MRRREEKQEKPSCALSKFLHPVCAVFRKQNGRISGRQIGKKFQIGQNTVLGIF
jgi:hypothetical protein